MLRELVTGVKQRVGLEPYGRMRVRYVGLDADHAWIQTNAAHLGIESQSLCDGIATMLDQQRRTSHLLDRDYSIFSRFLDMERDDLRVVDLAYPDPEECDAVLYDPMPGGSGLLEQITSRFSEVMTAAKRVAERCPSDCGSACIDCFHTYRNAFYHRHLDRHVVLAFIGDRGTLVAPSHAIPQQMPQQEPEAGAAPTNVRETRLRDLIQRAGFQDPVWDHQVHFGRPLGSTTPDCCFELDGDGWPEIAVYLDGLSDKLHGNPATRKKDRQIREELRARGVTVIEIPNLDLDDRAAMQRHFKRLGRSLGGRAYGQQVAEDAEWFQDVAEDDL